MSLETLTIETFQAHVDSAFTITLASGEVLTLTLIEARALGAAQLPEGRAPFALLFRHPALPRQAYLPQHIYRLEHASLGALEVFIVPLGPDAEGMRYEAIFT